MPALLAQDEERLRVAFVLVTAVAEAAGAQAPAMWLRLAEVELGWAAPLGVLATVPPGDAFRLLLPSVHRFVSLYGP